jgi:hypothetical protein
VTEFDLVPTNRIADGNTELAQLEEVIERAEAYAQRAKAARTVRAYASDWKDFVAWTSAHDRQALPAEPDTVAM